VNALDGGSNVGRYRIEKFLGAGAMGEVYLAEDPQIDRKLAIKTVRLVGRPQEIEERKKRLLREARAAGRLLHPNVVTLFDAGEAEGLLYLAFEFVEGTDLAARLEAGERLRLREVLRIARQAAEALDYAHGLGIVHRDIKPSNLLERAGRVKVADFGIAKMAGQSTELTVAGSVMGSPQYLSPEQIRGEELDGRSDLFSLGVVLYEMLSGKRPFGGDTITTLVYQILHTEPPSISELRAVPPRLEELLRRMLAKERDERIATAGEVAWELAAIEGELTEETLSAPAGAGAFEATKMLPRTGATPPPPPPALRSTLGTVPASPATTPSVPPHPPAVPAPVAAAAGRQRSHTGALIVAGTLLLAGVAATWYVVSRPSTAAAPQTAQSSPEPVTTAAAAAPGGASGTAAPGVSASPVAPSQTAPPVSPPPSVRQETPPTEPESSASATGAATGPPAVSPQRPPPRPGPPFRPRLRDRFPAPAGVPAGPSAAADASGSGEPAASSPSEPAPAPSLPPAALQQADQALRTGLQVAFRVTPPDAFVLVDRTVLGLASDYSGIKGAGTYTFPGPGSYLVKLRKPGMKDYRIAVEASATGGMTPIVARLQPLPAAQVEASDLPTVRVRQAIAFRVQPPGAVVLVDGQPMGLARRFSGGGMLRGRGEWLELAAGKHRVSLVAPGHLRRDIAVEVTATADRDRQRIDVVLAPGGGGG
jgi:eukaryotic-like serine/threonine-protein kinase